MGAGAIVKGRGWKGEGASVFQKFFSQEPRNRGAGGAVPPQYFENHKGLVRKSVLCPPILSH